MEFLKVWSDHRAVVVLVGRQDQGLIFENSGVGWRTILETPGWDLANLSGFPGGPLVVYGPSLCGVKLVENGMERCSAAVQGASGFFAMGPNLAYATNHDRVLRFDGELWTQYGSPLEAAEADVKASVNTSGVWAGDHALLVSTSIGIYRSEPGGELTLDRDLEQANFRSVWALPGGPLWAGATDGLWWRPEESWIQVWRTETSCRESVRKMWGTGPVVFFLTGRRVGVHRGGQVEIIAEWPCDSSIRLTDIWGNSETEVFVTAIDTSRSSTNCGEGILFWYDGERLREF